MIAHLLDANDGSGRRNALAGVPLNFLGESEDVAQAVLFLASDEARFITGIELIIEWE